jgi:hypothetical protein
LLVEGIARGGVLAVKNALRGSVGAGKFGAIVLVDGASERSIVLLFIRS